MDRTANANFLAGGVFGSALLVAAIVFAIVFFIPISRPVWPAFVRGAIIIPSAVTVLFVLFSVVIWFTANKH